MRIIKRLAIAVLLSAVVIVAHAQSAATTIILLRHAEKDTAGGKDPQLTAAGLLRAERIPAFFKGVKPDVFYTTPYIRTRQTITPWAKAGGIEINTYDPSNLKLFATELKAIEGKTVVVAGHSNTTPMLVNLLLGTNKYPAMDETDYTKLWVITIENGKVTDKLVNY